MRRFACTLLVLAAAVAMAAAVPVDKLHTTGGGGGGRSGKDKNLLHRVKNAAANLFSGSSSAAAAPPMPSSCESAGAGDLRACGKESPDAISKEHVKWDGFKTFVEHALVASKAAAVEAHAEEVSHTKVESVEPEEVDTTLKKRVRGRAKAVSLIELGDGTTAATFEVELSAKSYIRPVKSSTCPAICRLHPFDLTCASIARVFCAAMGPMESSSEKYGRPGNHRLYSKVKFQYTCAGGKVTAAKVLSKDSHVGKEGPLQPPAGIFLSVKSSVHGGKAQLGYHFTGRPHALAEPGFQAIKFRTSMYIWHQPYLEIDSCTASGGWSGSRSFGGSDFPTRRLWIDGALKETIKQTHIKALWVSSSKNVALVKGRWSY